MDGFRVIVHAAMLLLANAWTVIRLAWPLLVLYAAVFATTSVFEPGNDANQLRGGDALALFIAGFWGVLMGYFMLMLLAVNWHRFVLLDEDPDGLLPRFPWNLGFGYFLRTIGLGFIGLLISLPLLLIVSAAVGNDVQTGFSPRLAILSVLLTAIPSYVMIRLALILPAFAVGRPLGFGGSWRATRKASFAILVVLCTVFGVDVLISLLPSMDEFGTAIRLLWGAFSTLLGISILTTLYGHYVEGRALN